MDMVTKTRVCIVGAGPTGLTLANELARYGIPAIVLEQRTERTVDSKAFALHARSLEVYRRMGLLERLLERGIPVQGMAVWSGRRRVMSGDLSMLASEFPYVLSIPQADTEAVLLDHWLEKGGTVQWGHKLTKIQQQSDAVVIEAIDLQGQKHHIQCQWLVGCDGAHSAVRRLSEIGWRGDDYDFEFLVADGKLNWKGNLETGQTFLNRQGYVMLFPLPNERQRVVVNVEVGRYAREELTVDSINQVLKERGLGAINFHSPFWLSSTQGRRRVADQYKSGRVLLAGDAAHVHSPLGGQGLNTGIQDAYQLAWRLAAIGDNAGEKQTLLDAYAAERRQVALDVLANTDKLTRLFTSRSPLTFVLRNLVLPVLSKHPKFSRSVALTASGLGTKLAQPTLYLRGESAQKWSGTRLAHATLEELPSGQQVLANNRLALAGYELVVLLGKPHTAAYYEMKRLLAEMATPTFAFAKRHLLKRISLVCNELTEGAATTWPSDLEISHYRDTQNSLFTHYGIEDTGYLLIRPDGYIAFGGEVGQSEDLKHNLHSLFDLTLSEEMKRPNSLATGQYAEV